MKNLLYLFLSVLIYACNYDDEILGSCYISPDPEMICTEEYNPVCACNNLVYGNACEAEKAGNLLYRSTNKDTGEECCY
tara:strand:- start:361 stop:597 length:237 start_codon:yes stop_codon:yes gene_type:complete